MSGLLASLIQNVENVRSGEVSFRKFVIRRSERPGRFWFVVLGRAGLAIVLETAGAFYLWAALFK